MAKPIPVHKGLPVIGSMLEFRQNPPQFLLQLARNYGDIVRFNVRGEVGYLISHPDYVQEVLVSQVQKVAKSKLARQIMGFSLGNGLVSNDGDSHRKQRKLIQPVFHAKRIESYAEVMVDYTQRLLTEWRDGQTVDAHHEMTRLTMGIVSKTLYDADVWQDADGIGEAVGRLNALGGLEFGIGMHLPEWLPIPPMIQGKRDRQLLDDLLLTIIAERRKSNEDKGDLLSLLLLAQDEDGQQMDDKQLRDEVVTLFAAGHETTSNALAWTWMLLAQHPEAEARLHAEVDEVLNGRAPTLADLKQLKYTEWVIKESMRLYPPAWIINVREMQDDLTFDGYTIPRGGLVFIAPYVNHRDPRYFDQPERFRPERWDNDYEKTIPRYAYMPFGGGPRVCIGNSFAMMEAKLVLAHIAQHYQLALVAGQAITPVPAITYFPRDGIKMTLSQRTAPIKQPDLTFAQSQ